VSLESTLSVREYGPYWLGLEGPSDATLALDGEPLLRGGGQIQRTLARGAHAIRVEAPTAGLAPLRFVWAPPRASALQPVPSNALYIPPIRPAGLWGRFFQGNEPVGQPALEQIDPVAELVAGTAPLPRPYTIEWVGSVRADRDGTYAFGTRGVVSRAAGVGEQQPHTSSAVWIDGRQLVDNPGASGHVEGSVELRRGWHDIAVRVLDGDGLSWISLLWQPPGEPLSVVPTDALRPWSAERASRQEPVATQPDNLLVEGCNGFAQCPGSG